MGIRCVVCVLCALVSFSMYFTSCQMKTMWTDNSNNHRSIICHEFCFVYSANFLQIILLDYVVLCWSLPIRDAMHRTPFNNVLLSRPVCSSVHLRNRIHILLLLRSLAHIYNSPTQTVRAILVCRCLASVDFYPYSSGFFFHLDLGDRMVLPTWRIWVNASFELRVVGVHIYNQ